MKQHFPSRFQTGLAALFLWLEHAWPALCPAAWVGCLFLAAALSGVFGMLPGVWHLGALVVCGLLFAGLLIHGLRKLHWPTHRQALRRLERDNDLEHRPLSSANDVQVLNESDPLSQALWQEHSRRLQAKLPPLRLAAPLPDMARRDPLGLRFVAPLLLVIALSGTWREIPERLLASVSPDLSSLRPSMPHVQVWITPPTYTHLPPVLLENTPLPEGTTATTHAIPTGSTVLALVQGGWKEPALSLGTMHTPFVRQGEGDWRLEGVTVTELPLTIVQDGRSVGQWPLSLIPDTPPKVTLTGTPKPDPRGRLQILFEATDDYGVASSEVHLRLAATPDAPPLVVELPPLPSRPATLKGMPWLDLASHPWAGQPVTFRVLVWDEIGQKSESAEQSVVLPERVFTDPAALAVIAQRTLLLKNPAAKRSVMDTVLFYSQTPDIHRNNPAISLALSVAGFRLYRDPSNEGFASVLSLLWDAAVTLEDGLLGDTARALEQARKDLEDALASDASDAEIQARINQLEQALANHLRAMMQTMQQNGQMDSLDFMSEGESSSEISMNELGEALEQMRSLSQMGARESAQEALARMQNMLESLQNARPAPPMSDEEREARQAMAAMKDIIARQRALIDETFRTSRQDEELTLEQTRALRESQGAIRQDMEALRKRLENGFIKPPESLAKAGEAMKSAEKNLRRGDLPLAQESEEEALALLEAGMKEGQQQMAKASGGRLRLMMGGQPGGPNGQNTDPLGRSRTPQDDGSTRIPTQDEAQKARKILEELRNRANDLKRPEDERSYLNRLLKRF